MAVLFRACTKGRPTADYLRYVISRITTAGSIYLVAIA